MSIRYSSLAKPRGVWWQALGRDEKLWVGIAAIWGLTMFMMVSFVWPWVGRQQNGIVSHRVAPADFSARTQEFITQYQVGERNGLPIVAPPPGGDAFLESATFSWRPILQLQRGQRYHLLMSSRDLQHGFSLVMIPHSLNFQVLPGYITEIEIMPEHAGEYPLMCNEYCGLGHHLMLSRIIVTE
jgi:cytochrome c oxidase subunit 2